MEDRLTRRVAAHRDYLDDMLRSLGYERADLLGADHDHAPALPVACADCGARRDCAAWLDADRGDARHGAPPPAFCPNRGAIMDILRSGDRSTA